MRRLQFQAHLAPTDLTAAMTICIPVAVTLLTGKTIDVSGAPVSLTQQGDAALMVSDTTIEALTANDRQSVRQSQGKETAPADHSPNSQKNAKAQKPKGRRGMRQTGAPSPTATKQRGEHYALLIAVRDYGKASGLRPLAYTQNDVTAMADLLHQAGYRPENVMLMTESSLPKAPERLPERNKILYQLKVLLRDRNKNDGVLVAMAGHGVYLSDTEQSCFCPLDARLDDRNTLVPMDEVYRQLESCPAGVKLLLYDACRNSPLRLASRGLDLIGQEEVALVQPPPRGIAAFFSCSENEVAFEDSTLKHGVFFHFVIEGMRGAADPDEDGTVTLPELEHFVKSRVADHVRSQFGGKRQMPNLVGNTSGLVPLVDLAKLPPYRPRVAAGLLRPISPQIRRAVRATSNFLAFSPNGKSLALQGLWGDEVTNRLLEPDETIRLWDTESGRERRTLSGHKTPTYSAAFSPDGKQLASGAYDGTVLVWDVLTGQLRLTLRGQKTQAIPGKEYGYGPVSTVSFSPNGKHLVSATREEMILWDLANGQEKLTLDGKLPAFSPDGTQLASVGPDGAIRIWNPDTGKEIAAIPDQEHHVDPDSMYDGRYISSLVFSPDGKMLAGGCAMDVKLWDINKPDERATLVFHTEDVRDVAFSPDGTLLASVSLEEPLVLWDPAACALRTTISPDGNRFKAVAFSPDGTLAASTTKKRLILWDLVPGQ